MPCASSERPAPPHTLAGLVGGARAVRDRRVVHIAVTADIHLAAVGAYAHVPCFIETGRPRRVGALESEGVGLRGRIDDILGMRQDEIVTSDLALPPEVLHCDFVVNGEGAALHVPDFHPSDDVLP